MNELAKNTEYKIKWHTGKPPKKGFYITTRLSKLEDNKPYVILNTFGFNKNNKWDANVLDDSETIAWASVDDITPFSENK